MPNRIYLGHKPAAEHNISLCTNSRHHISPTRLFGDSFQAARAGDIQRPVSTVNGIRVLCTQRKRRALLHLHIQCRHTECEHGGVWPVRCNRVLPFYNYRKCAGCFNFHITVHSHIFQRQCACRTVQRGGAPADAVCALVQRRAANCDRDATRRKGRRGQKRHSYQGRQQNAEPSFSVQLYHPPAFLNAGPQTCSPACRRTRKGPLSLRRIQRHPI